jgi:antitoxin (DNA-binding transcriptional repressor) of toxin-antitoxin stability system
VTQNREVSAGLTSLFDKVASGSYMEFMRSVGLKTLKNKLSEYVRLAASGETVLVTDRDRVVAEIGPPRLDDTADLGRARAASTQTGYDDRRASGQLGARSSGPMIYLDSSVALAHLLAEDRFPPDELWDQQLVSSRLLECEVWNRINAHQLQISHGDAVRNLIGRVAMIEMVGPVLTRALQPFPVPVRTLDAIHLAALEFIRAQKQTVQLASYDERLLAAARSLEIEAWGNCQ